MKIIAVLVATLSLASAFVPEAFTPRSSVQMQALFDDIFGMDLFAPNKGVNEYGARTKKNLKVGEITGKSYVPAGLSAEEYKKIRAADSAKKESNYVKNKSKAGKFLGFNEYYQKRGTDLDGSWYKDATKGHRMAKTKFDYSGTKNEAKIPEAFSGSIFGGKK